MRILIVENTLLRVQHFNCPRVQVDTRGCPVQNKKRVEKHCNLLKSWSSKKCTRSIDDFNIVNRESCLAKQ
eukprot:XP_001710066.1 Hypothetical protein GL50803_87955 [Giardia lamblia ATCC 50803]